ncbi:MAG: hypothetical protein FJY95_09520 [Candidatus Handelsmanbacteria bacterium]|nr:hypothetical protein [Candidatus Handelsmanbacteria bacterium]
MGAPKIALVGGGSFGWTPAVTANILRCPHLEGSQVALYDLDPHALDLTHALARRYGEQVGSRTIFARTTRSEEALDGADFVVVTISTGGLDAMQVDLEVPEKYGIFQTVGDTVGPGGLSRSLRNVPVFLELAGAMEKHCPNAWMLNCSNPLSALTRVVGKETSIRVVGLCHGVRGQVRTFARFFGLDLADCAYTNTGIDHCAWLTKLVVKGRPAVELLGGRGLEEWLRLPPDQAGADPVFGPLYTSRCGLFLSRQLGALPGIGDRHLVEFLPGFLDGEELVRQWGLKRTSVAERRQNRQKARARIEEQLKDPGELRLPEGSDDVAGWIGALDGGPPVEDNLNVANLGQIPQLPEGAVVETRGLLDATGFRPYASPMPKELEAIVRPHVLRQELTVEAALEGSFPKALAALSTDPLIRPDHARPLLEDLLAGTRQWLPQFKEY